ncbi:uncharacterized protein VTP21DRAFT_9086 [Calcarisporiella thermophila]|uniref:uncharacterized protein n=1 Tax=Calcarisporiella thermophila TaxID=911321 RepID=UPI0037437594
MFRFLFPIFIILSIVIALVNGAEVSQAEKDDILKHVQYSASAAEPQEEKMALKCKTCKKWDEIKNAIVEKAFFNKHFSACNGYLAINNADEKIILSFTPTLGAAALLSQASDATIHWPENVPDSLVHKGYFEGWKACINKYETRLEELKRDNPKYTVDITGHSLGGSHAIYAAVDLRLKHPDWTITVYTSGSNRPGNKAFAKHVNSLGFNLSRLTYGRDPIPLKPSTDGFVQPDTEYYVDLQGNWKKCTAYPEGGEDPECITKFKEEKAGWEDHLEYPGTSKYEFTLL